MPHLHLTESYDHHPWDKHFCKEYPHFDNEFLFRNICVCLSQFPQFFFETHLLCFDISWIPINERDVCPRHASLNRKRLIEKQSLSFTIESWPYPWVPERGYQLLSRFQKSEYFTLSTSLDDRKGKCNGRKTSELYNCVSGKAHSAPFNMRLRPNVAWNRVTFQKENVVD